MMDKSRKNMKKCVYPPGKYMLRVCFEKSFYDDDIHPEIQVTPFRVLAPDSSP